MSFENWTIEDLIARCADFDEMTLEMNREEFAALRRKITELKQAGNSPVIPDGSEQRIAEAVELLKNAALAMLADDSGPNGPLVGRLKAQAVPGWIPVSERMPDDRTQVILWDAEIGEVTSGHYSHKTQTFYHCGDAIENEITHWMVLPNPPQEAQDDINALIPLVSRNEREVK